jgi:curved DNA-binding protein CbpA
MVKADVKQNYYADLDLPTTATTEEIKKQYRTLGGFILRVHCKRPY